MKAKRPSFISVFTSCLWAGKSSLACYLCAVWALLNICKGWVRAASNTVKKFTICARYRRWCSGCSGKGYATECLNYAKEIAIKNNCYKMMLLTGTKNENTVAFYKSAGYNSDDKIAFIQWL